MTKDKVEATKRARQGFTGALRQLVDRWSDPQYALTLLAIVIGLVTGLGAIAFSSLIDMVRDVYYHHVGAALYARQLYFWLLPLLPMSGALLVGLITYYFAPEAEGHGVPEVMDAMARKEGRIRPRVAGAKAVASALTIGSGGSAGTEGPIIQIGAAIGSGLGQWLHLTPSDLRVLIGCGAAAGIASIFNAPIAGVLFAMEVLLRDVSLRSFLPIIIGSVTSTAVTHAFRGRNDPIFPVPREIITGEAVYTFSVVEILNYAVLGLVCGLVALGFVKALYFSEDLFRKLPVHRILRPVIGALFLGLVALGSQVLIADARPDAGAATQAVGGEAPGDPGTGRLSPAVMGNGYPIIGQSLEPQAYEDGGAGPGRPWTIRVLLILLVAKVLATCLTLGSGGSGGVFAPSLFIGATVGGAFGILVQQTGWFPNVTPGAYALVGMAAVVAASIHAPLTAGLMLFELTRDYEVIIPIMLAGVIGLVVAQRLERASIYTLKLLRRGVDLYRGQDISLLRHLRVRDEMRDDFVAVRPGANLMQVLSQLMQHPGFSIFVVDKDRWLLGVITADQCRTFLTDLSAFGSFIIAQDLMQEAGFPTVRPDDTLADVMKRLARYRGEVPVVEDGRLVGIIWPEDVIERYNAELFKRDMASSMVSTMSWAPRAQRIPTVENTSIAEVRVPPAIVGRTLGSLDIRNRFGISILLIKQRAQENEEMVSAVPSVDYRFCEGDILLVMGPEVNLRRFERGVLTSSG
jgi:CIC family chloride channel protein